MRSAITVTITSAVELTEAQLSLVKKTVEKKYGKEIEYSMIVDQSIVGGVQLAVGSRFLDGSLHSKFTQLRQKFSESK